MSGVGVTGLVKPLPGSVDPYPTHEDIDGFGGFRVVASIAERDAIPALFRKPTMVVAVQADNTRWRLVGGVLNANWVNDDTLVVGGTPAVGKVITFDGTQTVWGPVPTAFAITSFAKVGATLVLVGASVPSPSFNAAYNQPATAVSLTDTDGDNDVIALPGTSIVSPHTFSKVVYAQSVTFTLHASSPLGAATANASVTWGQNVYFGAAVDPGPGGYTSAFANSLGAVLKLAPNGTYAFNASAPQSCFFVVRTGFALTPANFTVGGFPFACSKVASAVAVTNANGIVENYDFFRSDNVGLGSFNLVEA